jgi:hypothetical protein
VAAIAAALKQIKGLFTKGGADEQAFQSETDNAGTAASAPASIPDDEDAFSYDDAVPSKPATIQSSSIVSKIASAITTAKTIIPQATQSLTPKPSPPQPQQTQTKQAPSTPGISKQTATPTPSPGIAKQITTPGITKESANSNETKVSASNASTSQPVLPGGSASGGNVPANTEKSAASSSVPVENDPASQEGFLQKTTNWVKENPGKTFLVAGGILASGILIAKTFSGGNKNTSGLDGLPRKRKGKRKGSKKRKQYRNKITRQILL